MLSLWRRLLCFKHGHKYAHWRNSQGRYVTYCLRCRLVRDKGHIKVGIYPYRAEVH